MGRLFVKWKTIENGVVVQNLLTLNAFTPVFAYHTIDDHKVDLVRSVFFLLIDYCHLNHMIGRIYFLQNKYFLNKSEQ